MTTVIITPDENPRWTCCRAALGRDINARDFVAWMRDKWATFADENKVPASTGSGFTRADDCLFHFGEEQRHLRFDAWLKAGVEAGRWKELPPCP